MLRQEDIKDAGHMPDRDRDVVRVRVRFPKQTRSAHPAERTMQSPPVIFKQINQDIICIHHVTAQRLVGGSFLNPKPLHPWTLRLISGRQAPTRESGRRCPSDAELSS